MLVSVQFTLSALFSLYFTFILAVHKASHFKWYVNGNTLSFNVSYLFTCFKLFSMNFLQFSSE